MPYTHTFAELVVSQVAHTEIQARLIAAGGKARVDYPRIDMQGIVLLTEDEETSPEPRPKVVCLCGSTRFKKEYEKAERLETLRGHIVLTVGLFGHADGEEIAVVGAVKADLDTLHLRKIDMADEVLVIDVNAYVGASTSKEIRYAKAQGKPLRYWSQEQGSSRKEATRGTE